MTEDNNISKDATYNQASYLMLRLHELMKRIDLCNINPLEWNFEFNLDNFKVIFNDLCSVLFLISSKLTSKEKESEIKMRELISNCFHLYPVYNFVSEVLLSGTTKHKFLNQKNWDMLNSLLSDFRLELESLMEIHKIGNPSQKDISKSVVDM